MKDVIFWGATGQSRVLHEALTGSQFRLVAIFDNRQLTSPFADVPIFLGREGLLSWLKSRGKTPDLHACIAIGGARGRERLTLQLDLHQLGIQALSVIHPRAFVAGDAKIALGSQVLVNAVVGANATLGRAVIVNTAASVDHDCTIGDGVHIGPGAHLAGEVHVEEFAFVGIGAVILPRLRIGKGAVVGAGAVVTRDVEAGVTVVGNPARPMPHRDEKDQDFS